MKIALAQLNYIIGDFEYNTRKIINHIEKARLEGADLVVFSELSVCGYPPQDMLEYPEFIDKCTTAVKNISEHCNEIAAIVGCPTRNPSKKEGKLLNSAIVLFNGDIYSQVHKTLLQDSDISDESRYFEPNKVFDVVRLPFGSFALTIGNDLLNMSALPMKKLIEQSSDAIINISALPFQHDTTNIFTELVSKNIADLKLPLYYVNQAGAQTDLIFEGGSMFINKHGKIVNRLAYFNEDFVVADTNKSNTELNIDSFKAPSKIELVHNALVLGIKDYFSKLGLKKAILGLSGGLDSAVALVLAVKALGKENVMSLMLPSGFSSSYSISDAKQLLNNLNSPHLIIPIENHYQELIKDLNSHFDNNSFGVTEENLQARIRAIILMAFSNKYGYVLLNASNKSEAAVGYGTLYGDMCGGLAVLGDLYKTEVYELAHYINSNENIIPENILTKPPSAELRPDQKDTDSLPEYELLDKILDLFITKHHSEIEIIRMGFEPEIVNKVLKLVKANEWKRWQTPPILKVSSKAFGSGRRIPITAKY
ncbi:MAG: NAD+ synthase [Bacteroidales bacterium]|jgi:NAD+ synthase (glutamine-hydrolysing)|nr:NAD+ synthase [Bacteroidales bacterium]